MQRKRPQYVQTVMEQLQLGQSIFLASEEVDSLPISEIDLLECGVEKIPQTGSTIKIVSEKGDVLTVTIERTDPDTFLFGYARKQRKGKYFAFLSIDDFWDWWECRKIDQKLRSYVPVLVLRAPSKERLLQNRLLYDILINRNLNYQNISCKGCLHSASHYCLNCMRGKDRYDCWIGSGERQFLFR